jgi:hypothetical protein
LLLEQKRIVEVENVVEEEYNQFDEFHPFTLHTNPDS